MSSFPVVANLLNLLPLSVITFLKFASVHGQIVLPAAGTQLMTIYLGATTHSRGQYLYRWDVFLIPVAVAAGVGTGMQWSLTLKEFLLAGSGRFFCWYLGAERDKSRLLDYLENQPELTNSLQTSYGGQTSTCNFSIHHPKQSYQWCHRDQTLGLFLVNCNFLVTLMIFPCTGLKHVPTAFQSVNREMGRVMVSSSARGTWQIYFHLARRLP